MRGYVIKKLLLGFLIVLSVIVGTFMLLYLSADPAATLLPPEASADDIEKYRELLGLNKPIIVQLFDYLKQISKLDQRM